MTSAWDPRIKNHIENIYIYMYGHIYIWIDIILHLITIITTVIESAYRIYAPFGNHLGHICKQTRKSIERQLGAQGKCAIECRENS